ncbi:MAG: hypothetical protein IJ248_06770 [Candidatus Methanomethylophilaceae archaeon]|nr:hypothetical protein [Candidatus Methanomethylophilaceae archaeon]
MSSRNNLDNGIQVLSASETSRIFGGMSPLKATRYYNKIMTNPNTPKQNIDIVRQYREQNPQKFLSDEQLMSQGRGNTGVWSRGRGFSGGYRPKNMVQDSDGFYYDQNGQRYDFNVTPDGQIQDGGSGYRFQGNGRANGFSRYYGAAYQRNWVNNGRGRGRRQQKPISEVRSYDDLYQTLSSLKSDVARTRYFQKVIGNPQTPEESKQNLVRLRNNAPHIFASDDVAQAAGPQVQRRGFWAAHWKSQEEFDAMAPKEKKFFVKAFQGRNRGGNASYALKVLTNPSASPEDKQAVTNVVQQNPDLYFKRKNGRNPYNRNY